MYQRVVPNSFYTIFPLLRFILKSKHLMMFVSIFDRKHGKEIQWNCQAFLKCKQMVVIFRHLLDKTRLYASYLVDVHHESRRFHNVLVLYLFYLTVLYFTTFCYYLTWYIFLKLSTKKVAIITTEYVFKYNLRREDYPALSFFSHKMIYCTECSVISIIYLIYCVAIWHH